MGETTKLGIAVLALLLLAIMASAGKQLYSVKNQDQFAEVAGYADKMIDVAEEIELQVEILQRGAIEYGDYYKELTAETEDEHIREVFAKLTEMLRLLDSCEVMLAKSLY